MSIPFTAAIASLAVLTAMFAFEVAAQEHAAESVKAVEYQVFDPNAGDHDTGENPADTQTSAEHQADAHDPVEHQADAHGSAEHGTEASQSHTAPHDGTAEEAAVDPHGESHNAVLSEADEAALAVGPMDFSDLSEGDETDKLQPYKLLRSLQYVQDSVVRGDHSAMEMQRYLLGEIDSRLRLADQKVFDDPRNVDAALIYAMSGGNPETLEYLALKDKFGNFDNEITTVLRAYLDGRAAKTKTELSEVVEIYRDTEVGPYLTLVAANVMAGLNDDSALELFDWARLTAPGTLVEEAALRRSLFVAEHRNKVDEALEYAQIYARRFINSPYASQYADLLVELVVLNYEKVGEERLSAILSFMDKPRKREVYLRIARKAVINGLRDLANFATEKAEQLIDPADERPQALVDLYSGMANIPTQGVEAILKEFDNLPLRKLSRRDRALRAAAKIVASEMLRAPDADSLTQALSSNINSANTVADPLGQQSEAEEEPKSISFDLKNLTVAEKETKQMDEEFDGYVSDRKSTLERIDKMLEGVEGNEGS